jgi:hypothetical protein
VGERKRSTLQAVRFLILARPVFRAVDFHASYAAAARARRHGTDWSEHARRLAELDERRRSLQREMSALQATHGEACAECKGGCCREERFRDSIVDRVLQDPSQPNPLPRSLRSKAREPHTEYAPLRTPRATQAALPDYCPNCTPHGCALPAEERPVQCLAYHCRASVAPLSADECEAGIRALRGLMGVMIETAALPRRAARG